MVAFDIPQTPSSLAVCFLFFVVVKPIRSKTLNFADRCHVLLWRKGWSERNSWQRIFIAVVVLGSIYACSDAFLPHVAQYMDKSLAAEVFRNFGLVPSKTPVDSSLPVRRLLVVGEVGDGKSTLVNALRDKALSKEAVSGRGARGITKTITTYPGLPVAGQRTEYLDTPGIGDKDITPQKLVSMLEERLGASNNGYVDGVLVTTPVSNGRITLGLQVVSAIVEKGFLGDSEKWAHVILVGTKRDKADEEDKAYFKDGIKKEFFSLAPKQDGKVALVDKDDYSELRAAISQLPDFGINYDPPSSAEMSAAMSSVLDVLNITLKDFEVKLDDARQEEAARWREEIARQKQDAADQQAKLRRDLQTKFKEDTQRLENAQAQLKTELDDMIEKARTETGAAKELARQRQQKMENDLKAKIEEVELARKKEQRADREAQREEIEALKAEVERSRAQITQLRLKFDALQNSNVTFKEDKGERVQAELDSQEAELQSKELEIEKFEAGFNRTQMDDTISEPALTEAVKVEL